MGLGALIALSTLSTGASIAQGIKSSRQQKRQADEANARIAAQQADIKKQKEEELASQRAAEEAALKKKGSRLALISTSAQGILSTGPGSSGANVGRAKLLGN